MKTVPRPLSWPILSSRAWLWIARLVCGGAFAVLMVYEWYRWPNGSQWLGPLGLIWYGGLDGATIIICIISLAMVFACLIRPNIITTAISMFGILNWVFWGAAAQGIGC